MNQPSVSFVLHSKQRTLLERKKREASWLADSRKLVKIDTVDSYQGKENQIVILTTVRNNEELNPGFLISPNRVNVAMSQAMNRLIIVAFIPYVARAKCLFAAWPGLGKSGRIHQGRPCFGFVRRRVLLTNQSMFPFNKVTIGLPVESFAIKSYIATEARMPVVTEYVLRLLRVCGAVSTESFRNYFGFTNGEAIAVAESLQRAGLVQLDDDYLSLTTHASLQFDQSPDESPPFHQGGAAP